VKIPLYLAVYGQEHFVDYRVSLQKRYLEKQRDISLSAARRMARQEAVTYWCAAGERAVWAIIRVGPHVMKWLIGGAS
jgi:alpha-D-ribose 1-methylphosphonate 5-phosphate C-P lyase